MEITSAPSNYFYGSYESRSPFSNEHCLCHTGYVSHQEYEYPDDQDMSLDEISSLSVSEVSEEVLEESDDESTEEMVCGHFDQDAIELTATTEIGRIRIPFQSITLRLSDFSCLQEKDLLNDTIVDFYLNHIVENYLPDDVSQRVSVLPAVFWHNLSIRQSWSTFQDSDLNNKENDMRFADVLEFVEGFDLKSVDYIVIPVNEWDHWSLAIVCHPFTTKGRIVCFDSQLNDDPNNTQNTAKLIEDFFKYAWSRWNGAPFSMNIPCVIPRNLAQQNNPYDCGLYILEFAHQFLLSPPKNLDDFDFSARYHSFSVKNSRRAIQKAVLSLCTNRSLLKLLLQLVER